ncbi:MAG: NmrA family transcriptional regulator, partial [Planctomycetota bacterium]|nr:NmrA family transcriptional regulator [Planctomycetota bacterium]
MDQNPTFITGATGKTGRRILQRLHAQGILTRSGSRGADPAFDWNRPDGWAAA